MTPPRSDHFNGKTFVQPHHDRALRHRDFWRWQLTAKRTPWPRTVHVPAQPPPPSPADGEVVITWIGHATFLLQSAAANLLIDPVFSERVSPVSWAGPRRVHPPGRSLSALPPIHAVLLSHDHYDHCDLPSLRELAARHNPEFIAPLRHRDLLDQVGARRVVELDWWQGHVAAGRVPLTLTPSQHWSNRFGTPRNHRLWGGFFLDFGARRVWFVGDSGYDKEIFEAIRERCGKPDAALVPIGAYEPRWFMKPMHMNPAEAVQVHRDIGARLSVAMHWGTFRLTDEGRDEPVEFLAAARKAAGLDDQAFRVLPPGASIVV